jgi:hypothetical protein
MTLAIDRPVSALPVGGLRTPAAAPVFVASPPRLNFAGVCNYCEDRDCTSPKCVARYAASRWVICPDCDGFGSYTCGMPCDLCLWGIVEWYPATPGTGGQATRA